MRTDKKNQVIAATVRVSVHWGQEVAGLFSDEEESGSQASSYSATDLFSDAQLQQISDCLTGNEIVDHIEIPLPLLHDRGWQYSRHAAFRCTC
jgi:hypothetical protein